MKKDKIQVEIEVLTPVHIGSNNEEMKSDIDFINFAEDDCLAVIDIDKLFKRIHIDSAVHWESVIRNEEDFLPFLQKYCHELGPEDISKRQITTEGQTRIPSFKPHVHSRKELIIPGSSLKGAVRTQVLNEFIQKDPWFVQEPHHLKKRNNFSDGQMQSHYLAKRGDDRVDGKYDLFKFLRIGDAHFSENIQSELHKNEIINLYRDSWVVKTRQYTHLECIPKGARTRCNWQIPEKQIYHANKMEYFNAKKLAIMTPESLMKVINKHTLRIIEYEIDFWEDEGNPRAIDEYLDYLEMLEDKAKECKPTEAIIRVGANAGWSFMTGMWAKEDTWAKDGEELLDDDTWEAIKIASRRTNKYPKGFIFPKTRKLLQGGIPAGFLKISIV